MILPTTTTLIARAMDATKILPREKTTESCHADESMNTCEKPQASSKATLFIILAVSLLAFCCLLVALFLLHRRKFKMDRRDDVKGNQELDDYGISVTKKSAQTSRMPQAPPPAYSMSTERKDSDWSKSSKRDSTDSLTPSLRQAMGVVPRDTLANR